MNMLASVVLQLVLIQIAVAAEFHPNCTTPATQSKYVTGPNVRSTLSILWSAIFMIFTCTWTVQHLSVPGKDKIVWWRSILRKTKWMVVTLVMPEYLVGKALGDCIAAHRFGTCEAMKPYKDDWTKTHGFYANMGGFLLQNPAGRHPRSERQSSHPPSPLPAVHEPPTTTGDSTSTASNCSTTASNERRARLPHLIHVDNWDNLKDWFEDEEEAPIPVAVNSAQVCALLNAGVISAEPPITEGEIMDKSKGDLFAKGIALGQFSWIVIELIARRTKNLPCAQLEIMAVSFAVCTFVTHLLWFGKPRDVRFPTDIPLSKYLESHEKKILCGLRGSMTFFTNGLFYHKDPPKASDRITMDTYNPESQFKSMKTGWAMNGDDTGFILGAILLGACHCLAWDYEFPTPVERTIWRISSIAITGLIPLYYFLWMLVSFIDNVDIDVACTVIISWVSYTLYFLIRLFLIVESFRGLFYLPPEAFISTWSISIPHVG